MKKSALNKKLESSQEQESEKYDLRELCDFVNEMPPKRRFELFESESEDEYEKDEQEIQFLEKNGQFGLAYFSRWVHINGKVCLLDGQICKIRVPRFNDNIGRKLDLLQILSPQEPFLKKFSQAKMIILEKSFKRNLKLKKQKEIIKNKYVNNQNSFENMIFCPFKQEDKEKLKIDSNKEKKKEFYEQSKNKKDFKNIYEPTKTCFHNFSFCKKENLNKKQNENNSPQNDQKLKSTSRNSPTNPIIYFSQKHSLKSSDFIPKNKKNIFKTVGYSEIKNNDSKKISIFAENLKNIDKHGYDNLYKLHSNSRSPILQLIEQKKRKPEILNYKNKIKGVKTQEFQSLKNSMEHKLYVKNREKRKISNSKAIQSFGNYPDLVKSNVEFLNQIKNSEIVFNKKNEERKKKNEGFDSDKAEIDAMFKEIVGCDLNK